MYSWENPDDRAAIVNMNSELRRAQLELLSAHCATHQLRLRFSAEDLARFSQPDILRKSVQTAAALNEYYASLEKRIPAAEPGERPVLHLTKDRIAGFVAEVASYLREQRETYFPAGSPITTRQKDGVSPFFSPGLLERMRIVELKGSRVPNPPFYEEVRSLGFANLPEVTHMSALTFQDVIVFNEKISDRALFHAMVHAVQFELLGIERYADLFVSSFVNTKLYFSVPLEAHAFSLESKFAEAPAQRFSVEDQVRLWIKQGRY